MQQNHHRKHWENESSENTKFGHTLSRIRKHLQQLTQTEYDMHLYMYSVESTMCALIKIL